MKVVRQTSTNLMLQNRPTGVWVLGGVAATIGLSFVLASAWPTYLIGGLWIALADLSIFLSPVETFTFDKIRKKVTLKQQGWLGTKVIEHRIQEVSEVQIEESTLLGSKFYRVNLLLVSGKYLHLIQSPSTDCQNQRALAKRIRIFLASGKATVS